MKIFLPILFFLQSCIGWGDMFADNDKIIGKYYLVEKDNGDYDISYNIGGAYIGRSPLYCKVLAYAVKDSVLAMKVQPFNGEAFYYAINIKKDNDIAKQEEYELGSIAIKDYQNSFLANMNLNFKNVK